MSVLVWSLLEVSLGLSHTHPLVSPRELNFNFPTSIPVPFVSETPPGIRTGQTLAYNVRLLVQQVIFKCRWDCHAFNFITVTSVNCIHNGTSADIL